MDVSETLKNFRSGIGVFSYVQIRRAARVRFTDGIL